MCTGSLYSVHFMDSFTGLGPGPQSWSFTIEYGLNLSILPWEQVKSWDEEAADTFMESVEIPL